jgi:hypothetical protein
LYLPSYPPNFSSNLTHHLSSIVSALFPFFPNTSFLSAKVSAFLTPYRISFYISLDKNITYEEQTHFLSLSALLSASFLLRKRENYSLPLFLLQLIVIVASVIFPTRSSPINSPIPAVTPSSLPNHLKPLFQCKKSFWIVTHHRPRKPTDPFFYGVDVSCPFCEELLCWTVCFCCTLHSPHMKRTSYFARWYQKHINSLSHHLVIITSTAVIGSVLICVPCLFPCLGLLIMTVSLGQMLILPLMMYPPMILILHLVFWFIFFPPTSRRLVS